MKRFFIFIILATLSTSALSETSTLSNECPKILYNPSFSYNNLKIDLAQWDKQTFLEKKNTCKDNLNKLPTLDWGRNLDLSEICTHYFHRKLPKSNTIVSKNEWDQTIREFSPQEVCQSNFGTISEIDEKRIRSKIKSLIINSVENTRLHIFYKHDFRESSMISCKIKKRNPTMLTFVDQEGGSVFNIEKNETIPINPKHYDKYTTDEIYENALEVAKQLKNHCVDVNLAPVVDKYSRGYDWYIHDSHKYIKAFADGMSDGGVIPTFKHFPGCTFSQVNATSKDHPFYNDNKKEALICRERYKGEIIDNLPLFRLADNSIVMMSNNIYPNYSPRPAPAEKRYYDWLRKDLGFNGLIITDALESFHLNKDFVITLFENSDAMMTTSRSQLKFIEDTIWEAYLNGVVTEDYIDSKIQKINNFFNSQP